MRFISDYLHVPKHVEVSILTIVALFCAITDRSLFEVRSNLHEVWALSLDPYKFPPLTQLFLKYVIGSVVVIRTFTLHISLACLVVMLWPALLEDHPSLLLPWLTIGAIRHLITDTIAIIAGLYFHYAYGVFHLRNIEFLIAQVIEHGPAYYMWFCTYSFYNELMSYPLDNPNGRKSGSQLIERRKRARCLWLPHMHFNDKADDGRNLISESMIAGLLRPLQVKLTLAQSRSMDTLLSLKDAEEERAKIMGEDQLEQPRSVDDKPRKEIVMKLLGISTDDVMKAKEIPKQMSHIVMHCTVDTIYFNKEDVGQKIPLAPSEGSLIKAKMNASNIESKTSSFFTNRALEQTSERMDLSSSISDTNKPGDILLSDRKVEEVEQFLSEDMLSEETDLLNARPATKAKKTTEDETRKKDGQDKEEPKDNLSNKSVDSPKPSMKSVKSRGSNTVVTCVIKTRGSDTMKKRSQEKPHKSSEQPKHQKSFPTPKSVFEQTLAPRPNLLDINRQAMDATALSLACKFIRKSSLLKTGETYEQKNNYCQVSTLSKKFLQTSHDEIVKRHKLSTSHEEVIKKQMGSSRSSLVTKRTTAHR